MNVIDDLESLKLLTECNKEMIVVGAGWIGKLIYHGLMQMGIPPEYAEIMQKFRGGEQDENKDKCIIVSEQENEGRLSADKLEQNGCRHVYYISERLKNEMDEYLMKKNPGIYEKEVLFARKAELDSMMSAKVQSALQQILSEPDFPIFQSIEIETVNRCNGTCSFCPVNRNDDTRHYQKMSKELFEKIINELAEMSYGGRVNLHSNNEPLIDDRIVEFAEYAARKLPSAGKIIFTNGTLLNVDNFQQLISNIDLMCIDIYYDDDVMDELSDHLRKVLELGLTDESMQQKTMVQFICRSAVRNNRGGQSKNRRMQYMVQSGCLLPYIQMIVRPDGKTSLCCNDPYGKNTLGDVSEHTLLEVWNSPAYSAVRQSVGETRQNFAFCKKCDNYATLNTSGKAVFSEKQHRIAWEKVRKLLEKDMK